MLNNIFERLSVRVALSLLILELTYINSKSLFYMIGRDRLIDSLFSVVGALAFSMVTIIVMRKSTSKALKIIFPIYDAMLMFFGFNLNQTDYSSNAFYLSIIMSSFAGIITYSLGIISYQSHSKDNDVDTELIKLIQDQSPRMVELAVSHEIWLAKKKKAENLTEKEKWLIGLGRMPTLKEYLKYK